MPFRSTTRIPFIDTDASGRIHYTAMFRYFEVAEVEFFRSVGILHEHPGIGFPRVHVECDYRLALRFDDVLDIDVTVGRVGTASIELKFHVTKGGEDAAAGKIIIACMDNHTQRSVPVPHNVRNKLVG